jgi:hypothetical protein
MLPAHKAALLATLCCPLLAHGQSPQEELPLPPVDGACLVIKVRYEFPWKPGGADPRLDTVGVFLVGDDGLVRTAYFCHAGRCTGKESYSYKNGLLQRKSGYTSISLHSPFARSAQHRHRLAFEKTWSYRDGKIAGMTCSAGPDRTPTLETHYNYDSQGRLISEHNTYPPQSAVQFPTHYDKVSYTYAGDSVFKECLEGGRLRDSSRWLARVDAQHRPIERAEPLEGGRHFKRERFIYDSLGRLRVFKCTRDTSPLREDGSIAYPDRIERDFDERGRLISERFFAREIKRWAFQYAYIE